MFLYTIEQKKFREATWNVELKLPTGVYSLYIIDNSNKKLIFEEYNRYNRCKIPSMFFIFLESNNGKLFENLKTE